MRRCILSRSHPVTQTWIKSNAAIRSQINDHINIYICMIHPFSEFRTFWEALIIILTLFSLILIPFVIAFDFYQWIYVIFGINILFLVDIFLNFFTGHFESSTREIILDRKDIARLVNLLLLFINQFKFIIYLAFLNMKADNYLPF